MLFPVTFGVDFAPFQRPMLFPVTIGVDFAEEAFGELPRGGSERPFEGTILCSGCVECLECRTITVRNPIG